MNPLTAEPISASTVAVVISWVAAKWLIDLDSTTATAIALIVLAVSQWFARSLSVPLAKHDKVVEQVQQAAASR